MFDFGNRGMLPTTDLPAEALGEFLAAEMNRRCGASHPRLTELVPFAAQLALECIANSDALYHNVEHTMLVTLAGHDIFVGRALLTQSTPSDYAHLIIACLMHDIGYVRGILKGDGIDGYVIDADGRKVASTARNCLCSTGCTSSTPNGLPARSNSRAFRSVQSTRRTTPTRKGYWCERRISLASSETRITFAKPTLCSANSKKSA
jgi:hypothetical protein